MDSSSLNAEASAETSELLTPGCLYSQQRQLVEPRADSSLFKIPVNIHSALLFSEETEGGLLN